MWPGRSTIRLMQATPSCQHAGSFETRRLGTGLETSIVGFENGAADRQIHPILFGREQRLEYLIDFLRLDTFLGVRNRSRYTAVLAHLGSHDQKPKPFLTRHCLDGVCDQLQELAGVEFDLPRSVVPPYTAKTHGRAKRFIRPRFGNGLMPKPIQHQIGEPKSWRSGCTDITRTHGDIKSQTPISGLGLTRDNLLQLHTLRASNLGSSSAVDTQGSRVRVFGIQAELLLSFVSALVSPASAREKDGFPSKRAP